MYGGDDDLFGEMFDSDGGEKRSLGDLFVAHELFASDEELKLEYGEENALPDDDDDDDDDGEADEYDEEDSDDDDCRDDIDGDDDIAVRIDVESEKGCSGRAVKRADYPNERTYQAADLLDSIKRYPDIYNKDEYREEISRCRFILDNSDITAAKYLNYREGFLFAQAVKERFKLPVDIPDDDGEKHSMFKVLFEKIARYNTEYAVRIWHWVLTMFSPYIGYGDKNDADELTGFIMCDIDAKRLTAASVYAEAHPHFTEAFFKVVPDITCKIYNWISICIKNGAENTAKALFIGCLSKENVPADDKERFVDMVIEECCIYDMTSVIIYFRDVLLPLVAKYADKPMRRKLSEWQSEIAEFLRDAAEDADDNNDNDEAKREEYVEEQKKQEEIKNNELRYKTELCERIVNGGDVAMYIYCAVLLSSVPRHYYYRTADESIKIGDKVIVPVGNEKETTGTVVSVEVHSELTVPFPLDKTKMILRKA